MTPPVADTHVPWRLLLDGPGAAARNMAVDEALFRLAGEPGAQPVLRVYEWSAPDVSLGYFQKAEEADAKGRSFVRRYTGGGLVDHERDVTYTVVAPRSHPLGQLSTSESYSKLHEAVAAALGEIGVAAVLAPGCDDWDDAACFRKAVKFDVILDGKKIAGAAQRRTRDGFLQQGSILFPTPEQSAALNPALRALLPPAFAKVMGCQLLPSALTEEEEALAAELEATRYATAAWNRER
ncbi:lipoate-protein ligase A [Verrucomicrobium sp. GAS474]|uniref:lipoate--protein ligase family protein n=1 Tax=Verrucomicrobium sp. GAS474 TaxID=1882831 RepID=UPI00087C90A6|nr:lipoate--protein ligase family protein [Verrucomicrobium sp. GAS474]SDT87065.1 lipoate-protein ligase A [Verrucomicrobium sp. GAS474]